MRESPTGLAKLVHASIVLALSLAAASALADTLYLKNGNIIEGRIVKEEGGTIAISTGMTELIILSANVDRIEKGLPTRLIADEARRSLQSGRKLLSNGNREQALRAFEGGMRYLESELEGVEEVPPELEDLGDELDAARQSALPPDPTSRRIEQLYQQAMKHLDHVRYANAFEVLKEAAELKPNRGDVYYHLALAAKEINEPDAAIDAYRETIRINPEAYYKDVGEPLLALLRQRGRQLVNQRRSDEAIEVYEDILLLESDDADGKPVDLAEFVARRSTREKEPEDEILLKVYEYADHNDLIDLAFATITRVSDLRPKDPKVTELKEKTGFFVKLKESVDAGDIKKAAELMEEAPESVKESARDAARARQIAGELGERIEAQTLLRKARDAFDEEKFAQASEYARGLIADYPQTAEAEEAVWLLQHAEIEAPISTAIREATRLIEEKKYDEAQGLIEEASERERAEEAELYPDLMALLESIAGEREANRLYAEGRAHLDEEEFDEALGVLEQVADGFPETHSGREAARWLREYRLELARKAKMNRLVAQNSFFALADPNLWRTARRQTSQRGLSPYQASSQDLKLTPVDKNLRPVAWSRFETIAESEEEEHADKRQPLLYLGLPALAGLLILGVMFLGMFRPGRGKMTQPEEKSRQPDQPTDPEDYDASHSLTVCRVCGLDMPPGSLVCPHCESPTKLSEIEQQRVSSDSRAADYDPWDIRVKASKANDFAEYFEKARELAEKNDVEAAIENCQTALREDPRRKEGYALLADLYERAGKPEEAGSCYREILLLDPTDVPTRAKMESLLNLVNQPLDMKKIIFTISASFWWLVFWLVLAIDPYWWWYRLILCAVGFGITVWLWIESQKRRKVSVQGTPRAEIDVHRPLPTSKLSWAQQNHQAKLLSGALSDHTGMDVPVLSNWRVVGVIFLSILLLAIMLLLAWVHSAPYVLLGWPAGVLLFLYFLEIHPRLVIAHIFLRHLFEETTSAWADPHRPFKPLGMKVEGEFLIRKFSELPLRWALNPVPYARNKQGVLNSLQQALNRHWAFHRFYHDLHPVRDVEIPYPSGLKRIGGVTALMLTIVLAITIKTWVTEARREHLYQNSIHAGYLYLLDGELMDSREEFTRAMMLRNDRLLPHLYLGHVNATAGFDHAAERSFRNAANRSTRLAVPYNDYGNFLQRKGRIMDAVANYQRALALEPRNADVLNNLGSALYKAKRYDEAIASLKDCIKMDVNHQIAYTTLGLAYEELGNLEEAKKVYAKAVEVAPNLAYTELAKERLDNDVAAIETDLLIHTAGGE